MMNWTAAFGFLHGRIGWIASECEYTVKPINGKELSARLQAALTDAMEYGENYDRDHNPDGARE